ncbi:hypothetical protein [uncultured Fibrobacter sp.]|uniref:hypothetical protein n=1 Tax=uncultured Fibrobacter sp. TaxID=261512 RepID=UPI00260BE427|nr:hypothetical protein [uncultured Fibrobacter sp.]
MPKFLLPFLLVFAILSAWANALPVVSAERTRNLRQLDYAPMLMEYHAQTVGEGRQFFTYPRRNYNFIKDFHKTDSRALIYYSDSIGSGTEAHRFAIAASPLLGLDYRGGEALGDTIWPGIDGGLFLRGYVDSVDFDLDARIYAENHSASKPQSYDGEIFDEQNEKNNSGADYVSYSRYRAHLGFNYAFVRLQLARDVLHWGPGYYNNLALNQFALPYNMLILDFTFGPMRIFSAYADLRVSRWGWSPENLNDRNMYAHRYELSLAGSNLTIGMSEIQILYNDNKPWLFMPVVPLFMEKGNYSELSNNGSLSFDVNYQLFNTVRLYGEFFLDDMESPVALYENKYSNNRWAAMLGMHVAHNFTIGKRIIKTGSVFEIARVEPYTYCHFDTAKAQMSHLGIPIGNPNGPNSLSADWTLYANISIEEWQSIYVGIHNNWLWKGTDFGSDIENSYPSLSEKPRRKRFIHDAPMHYNATPSVSYHGRFVSFTGEITVGDDPAVYLRTMIMF